MRRMTLNNICAYIKLVDVVHEADITCDRSNII